MSAQFGNNNAPVNKDSFLSALGENATWSVVMFGIKKGYKWAQEQYLWKNSVKVWKEDSRWNDMREQASIDWEALFSICDIHYWRNILLYLHTEKDEIRYNRLVTLIAIAQGTAKPKSDSDKKIIEIVLKRLIESVENNYKAKIEWSYRILSSLISSVEKHAKTIEKRIHETEKNITVALKYYGSFASYIDSIKANMEPTSYPIDYRSEFIPFVGHTSEMEALINFMEADGQFLWWSIVGSDGIGKSRLAFELCKKTNRKESWQACFLTEAALKGWNANYLYPINLLLIIDSSSRMSRSVNELLSDIAQSKNVSNKLRILLVENNAGIEEQRPDWFPSDLLAYCYQIDKPCLGLAALEEKDQIAILDGYAKIYNDADYIQKIDDGSKKIILSALQKIDRHEQRPLYLLLLADAYMRGEKGIQSWKTVNLHEHIKRYDKGICKQYELDDAIIRIEELNRQFERTFHSICKPMIHRSETDLCLQSVKRGVSFVLHGRAGTGKSGCIIELLNKLEQEGILCLAIKLDKRVPESDADAYGKGMGLDESPILRLGACSQDREAVLLLDQLDAVRWTAAHSSTALDVCEEMIEQAKALNRSRLKKIVIAFVCRTFDLENDKSIKMLFESETDNEKELPWQKIEVKALSDTDVKYTVGEDRFSNLSSKVKELLHMPHNLFVWTRLSEHDKMLSYASSKDLVKAWWQKIVTKYSEDCDHDDQELKKQKNEIVRIMEDRGKLTVPIVLINNHHTDRSLKHLLSEGMVLQDGNAIRFVHQSVFDYFSMEDMVSRLYQNESVASILGSKQKQTPTKRYQLQMLFEDLLEFDREMLLNTGCNILESEQVRFFVKHSFLEVLGQATSIDVGVIDFAKDYLCNQKWRMHVIDAVLLGHPLFVRPLLHDGTINAWLQSENERQLGLNLIRSVSAAIPNDVYEFFKPRLFCEKEFDIQIYACLPWNIADDSGMLCQLRLDLLLHSPELWTQHFFIPWKELINRNPQRAIKMFLFVIENFDHAPKRSFLLPDEESIHFFVSASREQAHWVWDTFMPFLANKTKGIDSPFDERLDLWRYYQHMDEKGGRLFIKMIKEAADALINEDVNSFYNSFVLYMDFPSLPVHEIVLCVLGVLPGQYSDRIIRWFMGDLVSRMLDETGESEDMMFAAKTAISKHTQTCSDEIYRCFEDLIYKHVDSYYLREHLKYYSDLRRELPQTHTVYYINYWGNLQYCIFSVIDGKRLTKKAKDLLIVLNRIYPNDYFPYSRKNGESGFVQSPISSKVKILGNRQWLQIVNNGSKAKEHTWKFERGSFIESSAEQFSRDLYEVGKLNPRRIALLAQRFAVDVDKNYIGVINQIIAQKEMPEEINKDQNAIIVDFELAQQLFLKYKDKNLSETASTFCRAVRDRANEQWNIEILEMVMHNAIHHNDPKTGVMNIYSNNDKESKNVHSLLDNSINCVRGIAVGTIAALIWEDTSRYTLFKKTIMLALKDEHIAVNFATIECIYAIYHKIDRNTAIEWFFQLAEKDIRIAAHYQAQELYYQIWTLQPAKVDELIIRMLNSSYDDVSKIAAEYIAYVHIRHDSFNDIIYENALLTDEQKKAMLDIAVDCLSNEKLHEKSKQVITRFIKDEKVFADACSSVFYQKSVSYENDIDFIIQIMTASSGRRAARAFIKFLDETNPPLLAIRDILLGICINLVKHASSEVNDPCNELYGIGDDLSRLITLLYDRAQGYVGLRDQCLDMWDMMYEHRIGNIRDLSHSIAQL